MTRTQLICQCGHVESSHTDAGYLAFDRGICWADLSKGSACPCTGFESAVLT